MTFDDLEGDYIRLLYRQSLTFAAIDHAYSAYIVLFGYTCSYYKIQFVRRGPSKLWKVYFQSTCIIVASFNAIAFLLPKIHTDIHFGHTKDWICENPTFWLHCEYEHLQFDRPQYYNGCVTRCYSSLMVQL